MNKSFERIPVKIPSKKHHPKGITVIYEDQDILVVTKQCGVLTIATENDRESSAYYMLTDFVKRGNSKSKNRIFIVHRLDRDTSGLLVFAKNERAKRFLQDYWHDFQKKYVAVIEGQLEETEGIISTYLHENKVFKVYSVNDPRLGKLAETAYMVIQENQDYSLVDIELLTGRKNQIRVHFSELGHPVAGDKVYGANGSPLKRLALHSYSLTIEHPATGEELHFESVIPEKFFQITK
jgi:23S rRNA pseudouridine1911/1915/1917 synthase